MKVSVIGSGNVGQALAQGFLDQGHDVMIGSRDPAGEHLVEWLGLSDQAQCGKYKEAVNHANLIIFAPKWSATEEVVETIGASNFKDKVIIDVTNPLSFDGNEVVNALPNDQSAGEILQDLIPQGRVVKAFNHIGVQYMVNPRFQNGPPDMFICGNDERAKHEAESVLHSFGWNPIDLGDISKARLTENLTVMWITIAGKHKTNGYAFKLLTAE